MPPAAIALEGREGIGIDAICTFFAKGGKMAEEEDPNTMASKLTIEEDPTDSSTAPEITVSRAIVLNLLDKIKSDDSEEIRLAVIELRLLSKWDMNNRVVIGEAGGIPLIVTLLSSSECEIQENAVTALLNLSIFHANRTAIMETTGVLESISQVLSEGLTWDSKENCAALLSSLLVLEEYRDVVGKNVAILDGLRKLLNTARVQGKKDALRAIFHLALWPANRSRLATAEIVPILRALMGSPRAGLIEDTLSVLAKIALCIEGTDALKDGRTISMIIDFLQHGSRLAKENATSLLLALCQTGGACVEEEVRRHSTTVVGTMCTLRAVGSPRAKAKASELMKVVVGSESPYRSGSYSSRSYGSGSGSDTSSPRSPSGFRSPRSPSDFRSPRSPSDFRSPRSPSDFRSPKSPTSFSSV